MNKYKRRESEVDDNDDDGEDDKTVKETRKSRIKNKRKFKNRGAELAPKKLKGFNKEKPRQRNWIDFIDEDEEYE